MKKLYILLVGLITSIGVSAQNFVYSNGMDQEFESTTLTTAVLDIYMETPSPQDITFRWEVITNTLLPGWDYSLCDYNNCYVGIPNYGTMTAISMAEMGSGIQGFLKLNLDPGTDYGVGFVNFKVWDLAFPDQVDTVSFLLSYTDPAAGINDNDDLLVAVYPNPVSDVLNIKNSSNDVISYEIFNILGEVVYSSTVSVDNTAKVDVSDYETGVYFVSYFSGDIRKTEKLVIK